MVLHSTGEAGAELYSCLFLFVFVCLFASVTMMTTYPTLELMPTGVDYLHEICFSEYYLAPCVFSPDR